MSRATVTPLEARCAVCLDTGSTEKQVDGYQDCRYCDATERKKALIAAYKQERWSFHLGEEDMIWAAYLFAQRQALVAAQPEHSSTDDADAILSYQIAVWRKELARLNDLIATATGVAHPALPKLPSTPEEVVAFIGNHFEVMGIEGQMEERRITLTVHDLLSAFRDYGDAAPAIAAPVEVERDALRWRFVLDNFNLHFTASDALYDRTSLGPSATIADAIDKAMEQDK